MIQVLHISAECYPAAKTGGLGDVVGSLPKYMSQAGVLSAAVIPKYSLKWIQGREWVTVYHGAIRSDWRTIHFSVQQEQSNVLGFPFFVVDIPGLYDRPGIYNDPGGWAYGDEIERYIVFQQAVLQWLCSFPEQDRPRVLHCHDHHTGLIPFMTKYSPDFRPLANTPTVFTIHNGQYQGAFSWKAQNILPYYDAWARGYLDWNGTINPMASAIKCAWAVTTVSESYLYELHESSLGLEPLFRLEWQKQWGIINGIDAQVWDPRTDSALQYRLEGDDIQGFKQKNKRVLCEWFGLPEDLPMVSFIGRMVGEKGSDLLPDAYRTHIHAGGSACFLVLGTGEAWTQNEFRSMSHQYPGRVNAVIDYNEALAHQIYAGSDFLIMPSRVEPCGLNQMYAMRYGTIPIVRSIGGLKDTVPDIAEPGEIGRGIRFDQATLSDIGHAIHRGAAMWHNEPGIVSALRKRIMAVDFSWENTVDRYFNVYRKIGGRIDVVKLDSGTPITTPETATIKRTAKAPEAPKLSLKTVPKTKQATEKPSVSLELSKVPAKAKALPLKPAVKKKSDAQKVGKPIASKPIEQKAKAEPTKAKDTSVTPEQKKTANPIDSVKKTMPKKGSTGKKKI